MSALVCGKRSSSIFDELLHTPPLAPKRARCASSLSPLLTSLSDDLGGRGDGSPLAAAHLSHLKSRFPDMDDQLLKQVLEESGNDLDSAIKRLSNLCLEPAKNCLDSAVGEAEAGSETETDIPLLAQGTTNMQPLYGVPQDGSGWAELLVKEMTNASDINEARARASRVLEILEKSIIARAGAEAFQSSQKASYPGEYYVEGTSRIVAQGEQCPKTSGRNPTRAAEGLRQEEPRAAASEAVGIPVSGAIEDP